MWTVLVLLLIILAAWAGHWLFRQRDPEEMMKAQEKLNRWREVRK